MKSTTLVDLKAELYKKQQEVKAIHRPSANGTRRVSEKTAAIWLAAKKSTRKGRDKSSEVHGLAREPVEDEALNRSRIALEKKAKMYEEMAQGEGLADEELNRHGDLCLVDFDRKLYETVEVCGGETHVKQTPPLGIVPDEEWVEYVDHFGRTRNCHRTDLPEMEEMTRRLKEEEEMRKEEEEGVQGATIEEGPPVVHYQNVQNREARSHGVGYFKFSKDEEQRQEQLSVLNKLRQQTGSQRKRREEIKEKRKALLETRLAKVRQRKLKQMAEEAKNPQESLERRRDQKEQPDLEHASLAEQELDTMATLAIPTSSEGVPPQKRSVRPWDKGKILPALKRSVEWKKSVESERDPEFAPPTVYSSTLIPQVHTAFSTQTASPVAPPTALPVAPPTCTKEVPSAAGVSFVKPVSSDQFVSSKNLGCFEDHIPQTFSIRSQVDDLISRCRAGTES